MLIEVEVTAASPSIVGEASAAREHSPTMRRAKHFGLPCVRNRVTVFRNARLVQRLG
jgi:CRP/FNR family transcriptional regulator, cyclic AMP receptor protein